MTPDWLLLRRYAREDSQEAFAALTARYLNLVYSVCLREVHDPEQAQEVAQAVFLLLARTAPSFRSKTALPGWLFRTARFAAQNARTREQRRRHYEGKAALAMQQEREGAENAAWSEIEPVLNDALAALRERDRECVLLRFFQGLSFSEAGAALGLSEEAASKRVGRALDKMRVFLGKEGVIVPGVALTALLSAHAAEAVPAPVVVAVAHLTSGSAPTAISLLAKGTLQAMRIAKLKAAIGVTAVLMSGGLAYTVATVAQTTTATPAQQHQEKVMPPNTLASHSDRVMPPLLMKTIHANDAALKTTHLVYMEVGEMHIPTTHANDHPRVVQFQDLRWRSRVDTSSTSDGRFNIKTMTDYPDRPPRAVRQVYNGLDKITVFGDGKEVQFQAYVPQDLITERLVSVAPGPCFAVGRGLSLLEKPHLSGSSASPVLTGTYEGDTYRATLDPRRGYLATEIVRFNGGVLASRWTLEKPFHIPGSAWIATKSTYDPMFHGDRSTFSVSPSESWKSSPSSFDYEWQIPGKEIVDLRLNKPATFESSALIAASNGRPLTSASLLAFARQSLAFQAKRALENDRLARQHDKSQATRPSVIKVLLSVFTITMAFMFYRRRGQNTKNRAL